MLYAALDGIPTVIYRLSNEHGGLKIAAAPTSDLATLLANMDPVMSSESFVFVTVDDDASLPVPPPVCVFRENEGVSAIVELSQASEAGFETAVLYKMITLRVYSDLQAVGFLAAISTRLAAASIPCNTVSAYHHDYLFVPATFGDLAMDLLRSISRR